MFSTAAEVIAASQALCVDRGISYASLPAAARIAIAEEVVASAARELAAQAGVAIREESVAEFNLPHVATTDEVTELLPPHIAFAWSGDMGSRFEVVWMVRGGAIRDGVLIDTVLDKGLDLRVTDGTLEHVGPWHGLDHDEF